MRLSLLTSLSLWLLAGQAACAQSADDFFNTGAQFYISNSIPNAKQAVESGLKLYPDDVKLKKLEELLKQQQQSQNNQSQQNQQQQQQQKQQQQNQQNQQPSQPNQNQSQKQDTAPKPAQPQNQQPSASPGQPKEKAGEPSKPAQASAGQEMSPEEAKKLLDEQKGNEQFLQLKPKNPPESQNKPIKDW